MGKKYASGKYAVGECARSGRKMKLRDMVEDGEYPGLMVDPAWRETKHPLETLGPVDDPVALRRPAPRRDRVDATVRFPLFDPATGGKGSGLFDLFDVVAHDLANDTFRVALYTAKPGLEYDTDNEIEAAGYEAGGKELGLTLDGTDVQIAETVWTRVNFSARWLLVYETDSGDGLMRVNLGGLHISENGDFTIDWGSAHYIADAGGTKIETVRV